MEKNFKQQFSVEYELKPGNGRIKWNKAQKRE
jgi:hypothetical protein